MRNQAALFPPTPEPAAYVARDEALRRVEQNADEDWKEAALDALYRVACEQPRIISSDLLRYVDKPREPRALGPVMRKGAALGWVTASGDFAPYPHRSRHTAPARIWTSRIYNAEEPALD